MFNTATASSHEPITKILTLYKMECFLLFNILLPFNGETQMCVMYNEHTTIDLRVQCK